MTSANHDGPLVGREAWWAWLIVARIWRTVDVDRTVAELGLAAEPIDDDEVLGAHGVLVRPPDDAPVAILEPATEGRLAAALARNDEGEGGMYVAPAGGLEEARRVGFTLIAAGAGPFGRSQLIGRPGDGPATPFIVIVAGPPGTIAR